MKMSIEWHEGCLENRKRTRDELVQRIINLTQQLTRDNGAIYFYQEQIDGAKGQGRDGFDSTKFMVSKTKKE